MHSLILRLPALVKSFVFTEWFPPCTAVFNSGYDVNRTWHSGKAYHPPLCSFPFGTSTKPEPLIPSSGLNWQLSELIFALIYSMSSKCLVYAPNWF